MKFINVNGSENDYMIPGDGGIALLAVHGINSVFAYTEHVNPKIHVIQYPSLQEVIQLTGLYCNWLISSGLG